MSILDVLSQIITVMEHRLIYTYVAIGTPTIPIITCLLCDLLWYACRLGSPSVLCGVRRLQNHIDIRFALVLSDGQGSANTMYGIAVGRPFPRHKITDITRNLFYIRAAKLCLALRKPFYLNTFFLCNSTSEAVV